MKTTIETINGKKYTVVWHDGALSGFFSNGVVTDPLGCKYAYNHQLEVSATGLPALPRHPNPEDAPLLYRYASEGLFPAGTMGGRFNDCAAIAYLVGGNALPEMTHAIDKDGNKVEVAIEEE